MRRCGNRFSRTADPNVVIVKGRWIVHAILRFISLTLFFCLSLCPVPVDEQKLGEQRNEVTSSASDTFLQWEGGMRGGRREQGRGGGGGECPKTFEVTGSTSPRLPQPLKHASTTNCCLCTFPAHVRECVLQYTGSSSSLCAACFNLCAFPSYPLPHTTYPLTHTPVPRLPQPTHPPLFSFSLQRPEECKNHIWNLLGRASARERQRERERGRWKEK